ncbi:MAG: thiamine-phosphate kinase [Lentisphaerae bacterium]|nr:thiamine-phosphate kinase [Lentisphaerota bacterium]
MTTLHSIGETALIERLQQRLFSGHDVVVGPGDDCAVVRAQGEDWLLTSDPVIEGVHFESTTKPNTIGHKAIARALSDIAAMGGVPRWALVNLVVPEATPVERLESIYDGLAATARLHAIAVVGGDVSAGPVLELHLFAVGSLPCNSALLRSGAKPGDAIFVTGALGGSGLDDHHLTFTPRVREGLWIRSGGWATAMCDISDGLATDLHHLTEASQVGAEIELRALPCSGATDQTDDPIAHALSDGEDFELLFTVPARQVSAFPSAWRRAFDLHCTCIGEITANRSVVARHPDGRRTPLAAKGYDHFKARAEPS